MSRVVGKPFGELGSSWATADVVIVATADAWRLRVRVVSTSGARRERDVVAGTCREAVEAAELIVATSLSGVAPAGSGDEDTASSAKGESGVPSRAASGAQPGLTDAPQSAGPGSASSAAQRAATVAPRQASLAGVDAPSVAAPPLKFALGARVGLEPELSPALSAVGWGVFALQRERLRLELMLGGVVPQSHSVAGGGRAQIYLLSAGLAGCTGSPLGGFQVWGCAGGELGQFTAAGTDGLLNGRATHKLWAAGLLQAEVSRDLKEGLSLALGAQGLLLHPIRVVLDDAAGSFSTTDYTTPVLDIRPWLGIEGRF